MTPVQAARATGVVLTAATRWEASPLCSVLGLSASGRGMCSGRVGSRPVTLLKTGVGAAAAAAALSRIDLGRAAPGLIVSAGFAGALQGDLRSGDLVAEQLTPCPQAAQALGSAAVSVRRVVRFGRIQHSDSVLSEPRDKQECGRSTGALAVDMESAAIRAWAQEHGLPALALRVIFDEADRALPRGLPAGDSPLRLGFYAVTHPLAWPRLAALWPLQRRAAAAMTAALRAFLEAL
jgi:adenosylhomocysteine nucleosidase